MAIDPDDFGEVAQAATQANRVNKIVRNVGLGQHVDARIELGRIIPRVTKTSVFRPEFRPRVGPVLDGGQLTIIELHGHPTHVLHLGGKGRPNFVQRLADNEAAGTAFAVSKKVGTVLVVVSTVTEAVASGLRQWRADGDEADTGERVTRAAYRSLTVTSAGFAGATVGRWACAAVGGVIGSLLCPGLGAAIIVTLGGIGGGMAGGACGTKLAGRLVDGSIDAAGRGDVGGMFDDIATSVGEVAEGLLDAVDACVEDVLDEMVDVFAAMFACLVAGWRGLLG